MCKNENKPHLGVALVGCGAISDLHVAGLLGAGQTIAALCDVVPERARALAARHRLGDVPVYTDYRVMLDEVCPRAVHIATPHYLHAPMTVAALERGIHVLCEKPLAITPAQVTEVLAAARGSTARLGVCHQNRWEPAMERLRREVCERGMAAAFADVVWERSAEYYASGDWRGKWATEGGGVLINQAIHTLDLLQWIGGYPETVTAHVSCDHLRGQIEVEDTAALRFGCGESTYHLFATTAAGTNFDAQLRVRTADGRLWEARRGMLLCDGAPIAQKEGEPPLGKAEWGTGHARLIEAFYRSIAEDTPFLPDGPEAARAVAMVLCSYASGGRTVALPTPEQMAQGPSAWPRDVQKVQNIVWEGIQR